MIILAYDSASNEDFILLNLKAPEMHSVALSLLFGKNILVFMVLQAGTWNANPPLPFSSLCYPQRNGYLFLRPGDCNTGYSEITTTTLILCNRLYE